MHIDHEVEADLNGSFCRCQLSVLQPVRVACLLPALRVNEKLVQNGGVFNDFTEGAGLVTGVGGGGGVVIVDRFHCTLKSAGESYCRYGRVGAGFKLPTGISWTCFSRLDFCKGPRLSVRC